MTDTACDACLRRTWLVARLAGLTQVARHHKRVLRELLALPDEKLIAALGDLSGGDVASEFEEADPAALRAGAAKARLAPGCRPRGPYPASLLDLRDRPAALFVAAADDPLGRLAAL